MTTSVVLRAEADVTPAVWEAVRRVYGDVFARDMYIHWEDFWSVLIGHGFVMTELDCPASRLIIGAINESRARR